MTNSTSASKVLQLFRRLVGGNSVPPMQRYSLRQASAQATQPAQAPRLRVLRVIEGGQSQKAAGRMRISGRMADVCAELDRLAA